MLLTDEWIDFLRFSAGVSVFCLGLGAPSASARAPAGLQNTRFQAADGWAGSWSFLWGFSLDRESAIVASSQSRAVGSYQKPWYTLMGEIRNQISWGGYPPAAVLWDDVYFTRSALHGCPGRPSEKRPHFCYCRAPALVMFNSIECSSPNCRNYTP